MKCYYCKKEIVDDLIYLPILDKNGKHKESKTGKKQYRKAHTKCYNFSEKEKKEKSMLYEYITDRYFVKMMPIAMMQRIENLRNGNTIYTPKDQKKVKEGYEYSVILGCLKNLSSSLDGYLKGKEFNSDTQKGNYIMATVENNVDKFYKESLVKEVNIKAQFKDVVNQDDVQQLNKVKTRSKFDIDLPI